MSLTNPAGAAGPAAAHYVRSLLEILGARDPLTVQEELVPYLRGVVAEVPADSLRRSEGPGKWSVAQVVQHLADTELVYGYRIRMILAHDTPAIQPYDQDLWSERLHYHEADMARALDQLRVLRETDLALWRALSPAERAREGIHGERGPESVDTVFRLIAAHDLIHRRQIERIRGVLGI